MFISQLIFSIKYLDLSRMQSLAAACYSGESIVVCRGPVPEQGGVAHLPPYSDTSEFERLNHINYYVNPTTSC